MKLQNGHSIIVDADGDKVRVQLCISVNGKNWTYTARSYQVGEFNAQVTAEALACAINERIGAVRRYEYERGYKDGRGKRAKSTFVSCTLHIPERK